MLETLFILAPSFWVAVLLLAIGTVWAAGQIRDGIGFPVMAVLGTVAAWYVGDVLYNDYSGDYVQKFSSTIRGNAWWEVALFLAVFLVLTPTMHRWVNGRYFQQGSQVFRMLQTGAGQPLFQFRLNHLFWTCVTVWLVLVAMAAIRLGNDTVYYFFPFLGEDRADPWGRGRIGGGIDALLSLAGYLQMFVTVIFGVVAAMAQNRWVRFLALVGCLLMWPYYVFGRARNPMLAVLLPPILAWVFLRLRGGKFQKIIVLAIAFLLINAWFGFVLTNRTGGSITSALETEGFDVEQASAEHHAGLNMFEELCWINSFMADGSYKANWGRRYLAELVNPIPRTLWPGKPMIGIDYAMARGMAYGKASDEDAGVVATISTGMIGQGVVNFGRILGPAFAALLMSLWAAGLARFDLLGQKVGRIPLYALGMILTFNMGRDITFLILYPFIFGSVIVRWLEWRESRSRWGPATGRGKSRGTRNARGHPRAVQEPSPYAVSSAIAVESDSSSKPQT